MRLLAAKFVRHRQPGVEPAMCWQRHVIRSAACAVGHYVPCHTSLEVRPVERKPWHGVLVATARRELTEKAMADVLS